MVRTLSGEQQLLKDLPLRTSLTDIRKMILQWMYELQPRTVREQIDDGDYLDLQFIYENKVLDRLGRDTLAEIGMGDRDVLQVVVVEVGCPPLGDSVSTDEEERKSRIKMKRYEERKKRRERMKKAYDEEMQRRRRRRREEEDEEI